MMPHLLTEADGTLDLDATRPGDGELVQDLELDVLLDAMAGGDDRARAVARAVLLQPLASSAAIIRRQGAIDDTHRWSTIVGALDAIAVQVLLRDRDDPLWMLDLRPTPSRRLAHDVRRLGTLIPALDDVRRWCLGDGAALPSSAFTAFRTAFLERVDEPTLERLRTVEHDLSLPDGVLASASLDGVGQVAAPRLRRANPANRHLFGGAPLRRPARTYRVPERDQAGFDALAALADRSVDAVSEMLHRAILGLEQFFRALHDEIGFLFSGGRLHTALERIGVPLTRPTPLVDHPERFDAGAIPIGFHAHGLVDPCLALRTGRVPIGNDVDVAAGELLVITGANHGGKSTLLRSVGVAQLMLQAGLSVTAGSCAAAPVRRVHTHWPRAEDEGLVHGKLDDELARMSAIVDATAAGDLLLSNESFSSTNEHEGAVIAHEVVRGLSAAGVHVALVTHLFALASSIAGDRDLSGVFLRAGRDASGARPFHLEPGPPQRTSYGMDVFDATFGTDLAGRADAATTGEKAS